MGLIRVNPDGLKQGASEIEQVAEAYRRLADRALRVGQSAPSYDGQFGPQVQVVGDEANARLNGLAGRLTELGQRLAQIAEAFETADAQAIAGLLGLAANLQSLLGSNLSGLTLSLLRPSHISEAVWNALPLEDRLAILEGLGIFVSGAGPAAGTVLHVLNPLKVRADAGVNADILAYARPGTEVTYTGGRRTADGVAWYEVNYQDPIMGSVLGWVSSYYLSTGRSREGFGPDTVEYKFDIYTDAAVQESGGRLMSVTSVEYLQVRDGPTNDYAAPEAVEWGQVVRWTGRSIYIEEGGHTWYEVRIWTEPNDGSPPQAFTGWARSDRVVDYAPPPVPEPPREGYIYVPETGDWNASYYTVTDVDAYSSFPHQGEGFDRMVPIPWKEGFRPEGVEGDMLVPYGSLYSPEGVAMQGSGRVTLENGDVLYFQLDNPGDLEWQDASSNHVSWERDKQWVTDNGEPSFPSEIANSEAAEFRPGSRAMELEPGVSVAAPRDLAGTTIFIPELMEFSEDQERPGVYEVVDTGGAFGPGEQRIDVFYENFDAGREWHNRTYLARIKGLTIFVQRPTPPELGQTAGP